LMFGYDESQVAQWDEARKIIFSLWGWALVSEKKILLLIVQNAVP
jgi:hypothetical protein